MSTSSVVANRASSQSSGRQVPQSKVDAMVNRGTNAALAIAGDARRHISKRTLSVAAVTLAVLVVAFVVLVVSSYFELSQAQEHHHPPADAQLHEKFYSSWMMPDKPYRSCCNKQDCYPTEVRYRDGFWEAKRREDGRYIRIPWEKVEQNRGNPDGRNHVCMPPPSRAHDGGEVFCFSLGAGT
jgi:hypothetical protein